MDQTKIRTVTLEGDVYEPSGLRFREGSNNQLGTTLSRSVELTEATKELDLKKPLLKEVSDKIKALNAVSSQYDKLSAKLELAQAELDAAEKHLSQTNFGMLVEKRDSFTADLTAAEKDIEVMTKEKDDKWKLYEDLKEQEFELTKRREERLSEIEQAVKDAKVTAAEATKAAREADSRAQTLVLELESLKTELIAAEEAVRAAETAVEDAQNEESESQMKVGEIQTQYEDAREELETLEKSIAEVSADVAGLKKARAELVKNAEAAKIETKKLSVNISRICKDRAAAEKAVEVMLKKYTWIQNEMDAFGVAGGDYDFEAVDPAEVAQHLKELKDEQEALVR